MNEPKDDGWKWKIGILNGVGSAGWQELNNKVRRITQLASVEGGLMAMKAAPSIGSKDKEPQFDATGLVCATSEPTPELQSLLEREWGGLGLVMPTNGKMTKFPVKLP